MLSYVFKLESEIIWNMNEIVFVYVRRATFIYDILTKLQKRHSHSHTHTHAQIFNTYINICTVKTYKDVYVVGWLLVVWVTWNRKHVHADAHNKFVIRWHTHVAHMRTPTNGTHFKHQLKLTCIVGNRIRNSNNNEQKNTNLNCACKTVLYAWVCVLLFYLYAVHHQS